MTTTTNNNNNDSVIYVGLFGFTFSFFFFVVLCHAILDQRCTDAPQANCACAASRLQCFSTGEWKRTDGKQRR